MYKNTLKRVVVKTFPLQPCPLLLLSVCLCVCSLIHAHNLLTRDEVEWVKGVREQIIHIYWRSKALVTGPEADVLSWRSLWLDWVRSLEGKGKLFWWRRVTCYYFTDCWWKRTCIEMHTDTLHTLGHGHNICSSHIWSSLWIAFDVIY